MSFFSSQEDVTKACEIFQRWESSGHSMSINVLQDIFNTVNPHLAFASFVRAMLVLANERANLLPYDSQMPISASWLFAIGCKYDKELKVYYYKTLLFKRLKNTENSWCVYINGDWHAINPQTRGAVFLLLHTLNMVTPNITGDHELMFLSDYDEHVKKAIASAEGDTYGNDDFYGEDDSNNDDPDYFS